MGSNEVKRRGSNPQRDLSAQVYQGLSEGFRVFCIPNVSSTSNKNDISTFSSIKVGGMMINCDFCGEDWDEYDNGVIVLHEKAPFKESFDDEIYNMCSYRCLKRWLDL